MTDLMRVAIKNQRYRLKKRYLNGVPSNQIRTTSPVRYMTDVEWRALVARWSDPKKHGMGINSYIHYQFPKSLILNL
jgi:hypothetical protein